MLNNRLPGVRYQEGSEGYMLMAIDRQGVLHTAEARCAHGHVSENELMCDLEVYD
jgi:hypothetical protein